MPIVAGSGVVPGPDTEDLDLIFRTIDPSKLHTSRPALEEFHNCIPLPTCGICIRNPEECKLDPKGSYRCGCCVLRKEECSWKGDIAVIELVRMFPWLTPARAREAYSKWHEKSRRKRQRPTGDETSSEALTKRKRSRAPYRTWTLGVSTITTTATSIPDSSTSESNTSTADISTLEDLNAFNYATLKREKETAESARNQMAKSLETALRKIDVLEHEIQRLKTASMTSSDTAVDPTALSHQGEM
ncbi:hypothetical protein CVT25_004095 [Psilocybe cyanescens]|uniref:Uncharacterized protein n=1 Tax=Psilocybe cyanescens TaxID=93625 RepID=A0A409X903_PSICY|nr:hypothetical protein CVT25_004095 [Psilocybe cyanescens]